MDVKAKKLDLPNVLQSHLVNYNTLWAKLTKPSRATYAGRDTLCFTNGCQILLHNLTTRTEQIINANNEQHGDGVSVMGGHKTHPLLAYAERREPPKVFLVRVNDLNYPPALRCNFVELSALTFSDSELLFGLSGYPECSIVVWKWRTAEIMTEMHTGMFFNKNIHLKGGYSTQPICLALLITYTSEIKMWEVACCGKKCILKGETVTFDAEDPRLKISQLCWSSDGACFTMDTKGNVFKYDPEKYVMRRIIAERPGPGPASFCTWRNGLLVQCADQLIRYYLQDANWELAWTTTEPTNFVHMFTTAARDYLVVITSDEDILLYESNTHTYPFLRSDEAAITFFGLVPPLNDLIVTLGKRVRLTLWDTPSGTLVDSVTLDTPASHLAANQTYPYVALSFATGHVRLYAILNRKLQHMCHFNLTRAPLQEAKFFEQGRIVAAASRDQGQIFVMEGVPGGKFKVLAGLSYPGQIVDYMVVGARSCLKVFLIPVTSGRFLAGNKIVRFCVVRHKEATMKIYDLEKDNKLYTALYVGRHYESRDRMFYATPFDNKNLHELEVKRADNVARIINRYKSNHMMRHIMYVFDPNFVMSFGYDGIVMLRNVNLDIKDVINPHHHLDGGVISAAYDRHNRRLLTLGRDGLLQCNELPGALLTPNVKASLQAKQEELAAMFQTSTIGFNPRGKYEGVCWLEYKRLLKIEEERERCHAQRAQLVDAFNAIKKRAVILLNHNLDGPKNERLEVQDFNLNLQRKEDLTRAATYHCEKLKIYLEKYIQDLDRISTTIKELFWDPIDQPTRNLWAIFANFDVQSYAVLPPDMDEAAKLERVKGYREIEALCAAGDSFKPWTCLTDQEKENMPNAPPQLSTEGPIRLTLEDEDDLSDVIRQEAKESEYETYMAFYGSPVPLYLQDLEAQYDQPEIQTFLQQDWSYSISMEQQQQLRDHFNAEFEKCVELKSKELGSIVERNARLRHIIAEMNYFSPEQYEIEAIDPAWRQDERPELIAQVDNAEVGVLPYVSPSEQALLEARAAEEERLRLLLLADDFKERALMKMMNGVLEVRWEDELRREVPRPKCLLDKLPEDYNEEDLRQLRDYEEQVAFLNSERERYKKILTLDYVKVGGQLRDGVRRFNDKLKELLVRKIQIDGALTNELMRMHRMRFRGLKKILCAQAEADAEEEIVKNEKKTDDMALLIGSLHSSDTDLKTTLESLLVKDRIVDKQFKREFQDYSPAQIEVLTKLYKKRPRINFKLIVSACAVQEMANVVATNCAPLLIFGEPLEFVKGLDAMDKYVGIPPIVDEYLFNSLVRMRRLKIESELKIRACQLEIAESESTQSMYQSHHAKCKELGTQLLIRLEDVRHGKVKAMLDIEVQLVMRQAFVELPRAGDLADFDDAILVNRQEVERINGIIQETGAKKIKAMRNALQFRKEIAMKEWQHKKKKMEISDLEHEMVDIGSIKLTKEIQHFLKTRSRGEQEKTVAFERELELLRERYQRQIGLRKLEIAELKEKVEALAVENKRLNKEIAAVNIDVCEAQLNVNPAVGEKEEKFVNMRIMANLKRSKMVNQIQDNHNEMLVLQAELELCRLKTVPILDYKVEE